MVCHRTEGNGNVVVQEGKSRLSSLSISWMQVKSRSRLTTILRTSTAIFFDSRLVDGLQWERRCNPLARTMNFVNVFFVYGVLLIQVVIVLVSIGIGIDDFASGILHRPETHDVLTHISSVSLVTYGAM